MRGATFEEFLEHLNMSYEEYLPPLHSGINRPTVVLKRTIDEVLINTYNHKILSLMQANMDIQFVLDEYAVVAYLVWITLINLAEDCPKSSVTASPADDQYIVL
ncbi:ATP-dependent DNA helicase [Trichonephila clavipes]|nr:ATP-dependent DNA helicase [Trichonephila clavipes]